MNRKTLVVIIAVVGGVTLSLFGCGSGTGNSTGPATVQQVCLKSDNNQQYCYFNAELDFTKTSHREVGRLFAEAIKKAEPNYESIIDRALQLQMAYLENLSPPLQQNFAGIRARAQSILNNPGFHSDYRDEIIGMQGVFNYDVDILGDGRLSKNELMVFQLVPDVMRAFSCSATAAYGNNTTTGKTIVGRNLEWISNLIPEIGKIHSVTTLKNANQSAVNVGILGQLSAVSIFGNTNKVFAAILDSATSDFSVTPPVWVRYPSDLTNIRSYSFDLRYAVESLPTLTGVSNYMRRTDHKYAFNHLIFVADQTTAGVVENDINLIPGTPGNRSLRVDSSVLNSAVSADQQWPIRGAFATVNDFRLPGNNYANALSDTARWTSFRNLYTNLFETGKKLDVSAMKTIAGYTTASGLMESGAIFAHETEPDTADWAGLGYEEIMFNTFQSIVLDMFTMDLSISFTPANDLLKRPVYHKINYTK
jgi:hypothetical protein